MDNNEAAVQGLVTELRELSLAEQKAEVDKRIAERTEAFYRNQPPIDPAARNVFVMPGTAPPRPPGTEHLSADALAELATGITEQQALAGLRGRVPTQATVLVDAQAAESEATGERVAALALSDADRRAALEQAIIAHASALHAADQAEQAVARARDQMANADVALRDYDQLDEKITAHAIAAIKAGTSTVLTGDLKLAQRMRAEAVDELRYAQIAHGALLAEAQQARIAVEKAATVRNTAASHIIAATADAVAAELREADKRAAALRVKLRSVADTWLILGGGISRSVGLSQNAREALLAARDEPQPDKDQMQEMTNWYQRLQGNSAAEFSNDEAA